MTRMYLNDVQQAALFASRLQPSDAPTGDAVAEAISQTVRQFGARGCAARMAQEFGDHPEIAVDRMRWIPPAGRRDALPPGREQRPPRGLSTAGRVGA